MKQRRRAGPVAGGEPPGKLGNDVQAAQRRRRAGSMAGKKPLTVPSLISEIARSLSNFFEWWLSSASISAMPMTARAAMSGDSNGKP